MFANKASIWSWSLLENSISGPTMTCCREVCYIIEGLLDNRAEVADNVRICKRTASYISFANVEEECGFL
jgi:hypothetical protein